MRNLRRKAVTLIELIVVIIVAGMLAAGAASFIRSVIDAWRFESFRSDVVSLSRLALVRMTREVRDIKNATAVYIANSGTFGFIDSSGTRINYTLVSGNLTRNKDVLANGVSSLSFGYFSCSKVRINSPKVYPNQTDICMVEIAVNITSGSQNKTVRTTVSPRNL